MMGFVMSIVVCGAVAFLIVVLTKFDFKLASITILIDFMQSVALLGHIGIPWPSGTQHIFKLSSLFVFNFQLAAPECVDGLEWRFDYLWYLIECLPVLLALWLLLAYIVQRIYRHLYRYSKGHRKNLRVVRIPNDPEEQQDVERRLSVINNLKLRKKKADIARLRSHRHELHSFAGAGSVIVLYLYFALVDMALQVHDCTVLDESSGLSVLSVEPSEPCSSKGKFFGTLRPLSWLALIAYGVGIPLFFAFYLRQNAKSIKHDLWRRDVLGKDVEGRTWRRHPAATSIQKVYRSHLLWKKLIHKKDSIDQTDSLKDVSTVQRHESKSMQRVDKYFKERFTKTNRKHLKPLYLDVRVMFGKVYEDFSPKYYYWRLVQLWRKIAIAIATVIFQNNPGLNAGAVMLVVFISFSLQVLFRPYMVSRHVFSVHHGDVHKKKMEGRTDHVTAVEHLSLLRRRRTRRRDFKAVGKLVIDAGKLAGERHGNLAQIVPTGVRPSTVHRGKKRRARCCCCFSINRAQRHEEASLKKGLDHYCREFLNLLFDFNALESMSLGILNIMLIIGVILDALRGADSNKSGLAFLDIGHGAETFWSVASIEFLQVVLWAMFALFAIMLLLSTLVDIVRNCMYHAADQASSLRTMKKLKALKGAGHAAIQTFEKNYESHVSTELELPILP